MKAEYSFNVIFGGDYTPLEATDFFNLQKEIDAEVTPGKAYSIKLKDGGKEYRLKSQKTFETTMKKRNANEEYDLIIEIVDSEAESPSPQLKKAESEPADEPKVEKKEEAPSADKPKDEKKEEAPSADKPKEEEEKKETPQLVIRMPKIVKPEDRKPIKVLDLGDYSSDNWYIFANEDLRDQCD